MRVSKTMWMTAALSLPGAVLASPKVAVVYSAWGNFAFREEFDGHLEALGWPFEKFENKDIAGLMDRLDEFDLVVSAGVGNYENPQDMAPYQNRWLEFLNRGGALLITDASYGSVLDLWVNRLGPDFALTSAGCAPHTKARGGSRQITCDEGHPLLHTPHELPPLFQARENIWAHLDSWGEEWKNLVTCADGKSLYLVREVGRGCVVVTSEYSMRGEVHRPVAGGLLDNLWTYLQGLRSGVVVTAFDPGPGKPGPQTLKLAFRNLTAKDAATFDIEVQVAYGEGQATVVASPKLQVAKGEEGKLELPYRIEQRGDVRVVVEIRGDGTPAVALERRLNVPPPVSLELRDRHLYPHRGALVFTAAFCPDADVPLAACTGELLVDGEVALKLLPLAAEGRYQVDAAKLPVGPHRATLRLSQAGKTLGQAEEEFWRHPTPRVYSRPDGTTIVDGQPFFPFGWYHVSWTFSAEERLECLRKVAAGGFNVIHAGIKDLEEWETFLDEAEKSGVYVCTEFGVEPLQVIHRYKDKPAVLAWNPGDEPDGAGVAPAEMLRRHDDFKLADPDHPTYMTLCVPSTYARYVGCAEIIAPDPYPINRTNPSTVPVYTLLTAARAEASKYGRPVWGILQCFGYETGGWRVPTFAECRNMTYLALLAGVKGILYYTFADSGFQVTEHPELWADMQTLPPEIKALEPALLDGQLMTLETGLEDVFAGAWTEGNRVIVCVVNTSPTEARTVAIPLPAGVTGEARPMFPGRPAGLGTRDGQLRGTMGPLEVHVYETSLPALSAGLLPEATPRPRDRDGEWPPRKLKAPIDGI
jgi:hypothetical protein